MEALECGDELTTAGGTDEKTASTDEGPTDARKEMVDPARPTAIRTLESARHLNHQAVGSNSTNHDPR